MHSPSKEAGTGDPALSYWSTSIHTPLYKVILLQSLGMVGPHAWEKKKEVTFDRLIDVLCFKQ